MAKLLTSAATLLCPHGGTLSAVSGNTKALAGGAAILRAQDSFVVSGCPFSLPSGPHPCVSVEWQMPAAQVAAAGGQALTESSLGLCKAADGAIQGTVQVASVQQQASTQ